MRPRYPLGPTATESANDNRKVLVFISDFGLEVVARLKERVDAHHDSIEEALGPRKTSQLKRLLESFIAESAPD